MTIAASWAAAQTAPVPARKSAGPATAAAANPSYKDLKYPALRPIAIPPLDPVTLPNGMRLYLVEDHDWPAIHGLALVRTGNLFDPGDRVGLAALTGQAMRTGGGGARSIEQIDERLENLAGTVDCSIGETSGVLAFTALKESTGEVLSIFKDVMTAPAFRQDRIERAKQQLRNTIAHRNDAPAAILRREFTNIVYGKDTPYGWPLEYAHLDRITRGDLVNFHRRYFFPGNVMLAVWGDFDKAQMQARIEKLFADWTVEQAAVPPFPKVSGAPAPGTFLARISDPQQSWFAVGQLGGELRDKDYAALELMADILGGGEYGRLYQRIGAKGEASNLSAGWRAEYDHPGLFQVSAGATAFKTVATLKAVTQAIESMRSAEVGEEDLRAAKERAVNRLAFAFDTRDKTIEQSMLYEYFGYPKDFAAQYRKAVEGVTRADVLRVAKERLDPAKMTLVAVGNPAAFQEPLESLGSPVTAIDLTIPPQRTEALAGDAASRQRGKAILARVQRAVGGADKLAAVKDYVQEFSIQFAPSAGGMLVTETDRWIGPNAMRQESVLPTGKYSTYCDGKSGWVATSQGSAALLGPQLKQLQGDLFRVFFTLFLSDRLPERVVNAHDDFTVEIGDGGGAVVRLVLDPDTGLPRNALYDVVTATGTVSVTETYTDYRDAGGLKLPFQISVMPGGQKYVEIAVKSWQINTGLKLADLERRP